MARIPDAEIDRIKKQTDLAALVRSRGVELKPHGKGHLIGRCPFHDDRTPSLVVTPGKGLFHCLGCGAAGNPIQFVERFDGVSFRHAFELLGEGGAAVFASSCEGPTKRTRAQRLESPLDPGASDAELLELTVGYYHERLMHEAHGQAGRDYLARRGLDDPGLLERYRMGVADRSLGLRLAHKRTVEGQAIRERLEKLGLFRDTGHEHFNGCVVLPICDEAGRVVELYGRRLSRGHPKHLYLPGPHVGIWNAAGLGPDIVLCEAALDALTWVRHGIEQATFIYGTQGFAEGFLEELVRLKVRTVRLAYDNDEAGNRAADRDAERLLAKGIEVYRVKLPYRMDVNEYALKVTPAAQSLRHALSSAEWLGGAVDPCSRARSSSLAAIAASEPGEGVGIAATKKEGSHPAPAATVGLVQPLGEYHVLELGSRSYRVGGLLKNNSLDVLKVSLRLRVEEGFHVDTLDLYRDADRRRFMERAAEETRLDRELIKRDLGKLLLALEQAQEERLAAPVEAKDDAPELTPEDRAAALAFLREPGLIDRIREAFDTCGLVGEESNRLAAYLACTSRKLARPLAVIIQSTSAAGKSTLMDAVLAMFPEEERIQYSAMTGQSLYYLGETNLKHRILAISEEEGAEKASYALKLLQSEGSLTIASTGKDPQSGRMETQEYHVEGPVMIFLTTTSIDIDEELMNRCLVLSVDESREQTERIHQRQREARTLEGLRRQQQKQDTLRLLRHAQRLLEPVAVLNPWADQLTFTSERTRTRRDHQKYLGLIDAIALLHQHQRPRHTDPQAGSYLTATLDDIALANQLAPDLLARSLDELPPQTRRVFEEVKALVRDRMEAESLDVRLALFTRREVRERLGWSVTQVREHLERLRELELVAARHGRPGSPFQYELLSDPAAENETAGVGLLDVEELRLRSQPVGKNGLLSEGCREAIRQAQAAEKAGFEVHLSACCDRTSGPALGGAS